MSDLSTRARTIAAKKGLLGGTSVEQRLTIWLDLQQALGEIAPWLRLDINPPAKPLGRALSNVATLCALWGTDIIDATQAAVEQSELAMKTVMPGTKAPVPNAAENDGTLRDPATGNARIPE